ncbi:WXG100 family type VII secretion target [Paenibacillus cucumis (ex Kampfer et al. 2016)]|uniref:WXG100 family type VII secretion target n=1 Tax=Paenibacillus cucumis (ex Kampfer et al. 2016) TaxID=1776858 RepID=A0ABS7KF15_9BACL|nr:WXG100 family type VII secretion target [Paenibacillus cucumis (ex Kampfer et al. 2016)]MBY0202728.1 WXG100 family type VII secretion target [Paenibacillus cucumis (ex Kampfer et al. 2016)]
MSTIKVTPEQLHHVSNQVDQARQQLEHIQDNLSRQIMFLQAVWLGVTQERFYGDFARSRPVLQKALESMLYTSKELTDIATRFEQADAEKGSLGGVIGAVGAAAMMKSSGSDAGSEDKGYRMAQVNVFGKMVQMPVNEDGVTDQAALQAYQKDQGHLDFNRMQAVGTEEPGEDIFALQIEAFENRIHPFTGEPVNDRYAQMMVTSLKFSQILMAFQMVRGSMPGRKGPFRLPSSHPAVAKLKKNIAEVNSKSEKTKLNAGGGEAKPKPKTEIINTGQYSGGLVKVPKGDAAADKLADKLAGESRVKFKNDPKGREFDTVSDEYIAQTKPPLNSLDKQFRKQAKATIEAAIETGKKAYFHFEGKPDDRVLRQLNEYAERYKVDIVIDTRPL